MIDEEGTLLLTNETIIKNDMLNKIKKIVIDISLQGIVFRNIFENDNSTRNLINLEEVDFSNYTFNRMYFFTFENCNKLKIIELPSTIKILNAGCFAGCEKLESVILNGVESIDYCAFAGCISLKYLFISDEINKIKENAFNGISKEQEITIICPDRFYNYFKEIFPNASINENDFVLK
jgi:hypothetical protein